MKSGLAADDGVALHFVGRKLSHVVSSRPGSSAYTVRRVAGTIEETKIAPEYLGKTKSQHGAALYRRSPRRA